MTRDHFNDPELWCKMVLCRKIWLPLNKNDMFSAWQDYLRGYRPQSNAQRLTYPSHILRCGGSMVDASRAASNLWMFSTFPREKSFDPGSFWIPKSFRKVCDQNLCTVSSFEEALSVLFQSFYPSWPHLSLQALPNVCWEVEKVGSKASGHPTFWGGVTIDFSELAPASSSEFATDSSSALLALGSALGSHLEILFF